MDEDQKTRTLDDTTIASDPGDLTLAHDKLERLRPDLYGMRGLVKSLLSLLRLGFPQRVYIAEQLRCGDSRAAVVVSTSPLLIAAYTDELDCVAMLRFPSELVRRYRLSPGTRLLTVNCYGALPEYDPDLIVGPEALPRWTGFHPLIADFLTHDRNRLESRKRAIAESEWSRAERLAQEYLRLRPGVARDGRPVYASTPASEGS